MALERGADLPLLVAVGTEQVLLLLVAAGTEGCGG